MPSDVIVSEVAMSEDGVYRYALRRTWQANAKTVMFVMLNPSTADVQTNDPTMKRCINYAKRWGYGSVVVGNLFALRTPSPMDLSRHEDPVGPHADHYLWNMAQIEAHMIVAAWGAHAMAAGRAERVLNLLRGTGTTVQALTLTKDGSPGHPLYLPADIEPRPFEGITNRRGEGAP